MTNCKKTEIEKVIRTLPENTSVEEAMEKLFLLSKIEKGLHQAAKGKIVSQKEVEKRLKKWSD